MSNRSLGPSALIFKPGIYTFPNRIELSSTSRAIHLGGESGSVYHRTVTGTQILPRTVGGITQQDSFNLILTINPSESMASIEAGKVIVVHGYSGASGGLSGGTAGLYNKMVGAYAIDNVNGNFVRVIVREQSGLSAEFWPYLNTTSTTEYISGVDVYGVTLKSESNAGLYYSGPNTRTYIGAHKFPNGVEITGIGLICGNTGGTVDDPGLTPYLPGNSFNNAIGVQTEGGYVNINKSGMVGYPISAHSYDGGVIDMTDSHIAVSQYGLTIEGGSRADIKGSSICRSGVPVIVSEASSLTIRDDKTKKSSLVKNAGAVVAKQGSTVDISQTVIRGPALYAERSNAGVGKFVDFLNENTEDFVTDVGITQAPPDNKFVILAVDSTIHMQDMEDGSTAYNPVTKTDETKMKIGGTISVVDSIVRGSVSKTNSVVSVSTNTIEESIKEATLKKG